MKVTEVRIKLADRMADKLKAFATITLENCFVVRDIKVIEGCRGVFVAMPSRRLTARCPGCKAKNHLRASYCNECGAKIPKTADFTDDRGRTKLHADVAHPINQSCRGAIQDAIVAEYELELDRSKQDGYTPRRDVSLDDGPEGEEDYDQDAPQGEARRGPSNDLGMFG